MNTSKIKYFVLLVLILPLLFSSCNADASAGLFRQIAESTAPIDIVYSQLLGVDNPVGTKLFYAAEGGLFSTDGTVRTTLVESTDEQLIRFAYYDPTTSKIAYLTNYNDDYEENHFSNILDIIDVTGSNPAATITLTDSAYLTEDTAIKHLYQNGLVRLLINENIDSLVKYTSATGASSGSVADVINFDEAAYANYDFDSLLQMTGFETEPLSTAAPIIISFVEDDGDTSYLHYFYDGNSTDTLFQITNTELNEKRIANFFLDTTYLYILTTDGILYGGVYTSSSILATISMTEMYSSSNTYASTAFMYGVTDGTTIHLITKTTSINDALSVFSFPKGSTASDVTDTVSVKYGYGEYLDTASIVSALHRSIVGDTYTLLVATQNNGLFRLTIDAAKANLNNETNGDSSESEDSLDSSSGKF